MKQKLTDEQKKRTRKYIARYLWRFVFLTYAYLTAIILGNIAIAMLDLYYMHSEEFRNAASFGTVMIMIIGLRVDQEKEYSKMKSEIQKISEEAVNEKQV